MLSIIIPTFQAATSLAATLTALQNVGADDHIEIIIADGGSTDPTIHIARAFGIKPLNAPKGRGNQLRAGADQSLGDWLLFLHADTVLEPEWWQAAEEFMQGENNRFQAAYFLFGLNDDGPNAKRLEHIVDWRCQTFSLPYGDQGLLISREFYDFLKGYAQIPLMEDVDIIRRIGANRLHCLPVIATTSAERFRRGGYILRPLKNLICLSLFLLGVSPSTIENLYR